MKSYPDSVRYLYALGNEIKAVKFGLDSIREVLRRLEHPERACRFVHVAGTNGKGSTCAMIEAAMRAAGLRTGLYTSPHLVQPTERIQIAGRPVSEAEFARAFDIVHQAAREMESHPTYFETVTAMAFVLFRDHAVDRVVLEVGMGGRLDATNVVAPELCVITPIDYDHEAWLGNTIERIAGEKAGILKPGIPAVIARQRPEAAEVIARRAEEVRCRLVWASDFPARQIREHARGSEFVWQGDRIRCPLAGSHQVENALTALLALRELGVPVEGIAETRWPGRLEWVAGPPEIILDGAHNPAGVRALAAYLERHFRHRKVWLIFATMRDKNIGEIADTLFPLAQELILTMADSPRSLDPETLLRHCGHPRARTAANLRAALQIVQREAALEDAIFISGSLYLVGEARALLLVQ